MAVYVDDMQAPYRSMIMCHMLADTDKELHEMAQNIGVARKWHQKPGTAHSHYDICMSKRKLAVKAGAIEIDRIALSALLKMKKLKHSEKIVCKIP